MYRSAAVSTFTLLCSRQHHPSQNPLRLAKPDQCPLNSNSPLPPPSPGQPSFFAVSEGLTTLGTLHKRNHTGCVCDWLISCAIMSSRFIGVAACVRISLSHVSLSVSTAIHINIYTWSINITSIVYHIHTTFCLSTHLLMDSGGRAVLRF